MLAVLADLVLPLDCAGCGARGPLCSACAAELAGAPAPTRPTPAPSGLPACLTAAPYGGAVRELILGYKERGRRTLAAPLGAALAAVVRTGWPGPGPVALVPVPATPGAIRARHGDHMLRLARSAARSLRERGQPTAVASALRARPKADAAHLDREQRAAAAHAAFAVRPGTARLAALRAVADCGAVVLVDDILTTGATLAAAAERLREAGVVVTFAATVAATELRGSLESPRLSRSAGLAARPGEITAASSRDGGDGAGPASYRR